MGNQCIIKNKKMFFVMGDTSSEVKLLMKNEKNLNIMATCQELYFIRNESHTYYFSNPLDLYFDGKPQEYSTEGDVSYFPTMRKIGITLEDEEETLGVPRYRIGRLNANLLAMQGLTKYEEAKFHWEFQCIQRRNLAN